MNKPKKLIRDKVISKLKEGEWEKITDKDELNKLFTLKIKEELEEIVNSDFKDIMEFVDLLEVAFTFAKHNGFNYEDIRSKAVDKLHEKGGFTGIALNNLNPENPSNYIYITTSVRVPKDRYNELLEKEFRLNTLDK